MKVWLFALIGLVVLLPSAFGQSSPDGVKPPQQPLIKTPADFDHWSIVVTPLVPPPVGLSKPVVKEMDFSKSPRAATRTTIWSNGKSGEDWIEDGFYLSRGTDRPDIYLSPMKLRPPASFSNGFSNYDTVYPGFTWLDLKYYQKVEHVNGRKCYHYVKGTLQGWIDVETNLPVAYTDPTNRGEYQFLPASTEELKMPDAFAKLLENYKKAVAR